MECVVAFCSLFAAERQGGLVCLGSVVVIAIGLECALWCSAQCFVVLVVDGVCHPLEEGGLL